MKDKLNINCRGCGRDSGVERPMPGYNVGEYVEKTGFTFFPLDDGGNAWTCGNCKTTLVQHAEAIKSIVKSEEISVSTILFRKSS